MWLLLRSLAYYLLKYTDSVSPHSPPSPHWNLALSPSPSRSTSARDSLQGQSTENILDVSFRPMFSPASEVEIPPKMNGGNQANFAGPSTVGTISPEDKYAERTVSPARSRTSSRSLRSQFGRSSRSSSRSRSPSCFVGKRSPLSPSSSTRTSPNYPNLSLQLVHDENITDESTTECLDFYPPGIDYESSPRVPRYDSIVEEQPASPFDANFLNQLHIQDGFSSPLLKTASVIVNHAPTDSLSSEDEFKISTPTQPRGAPKNTESSPSRGSGLKTILSNLTSGKNAGNTSPLRSLTLPSPVSTSTASPLITNNVIRPSSLLARLSKGKGASSFIASGMLPSPLHLPIRRPENRRRLSLSPSLPPIPEFTLREASPRPLSRTESDSDRESLGILELNAHDLLFGGSLSEDEDGDNEGGGSPPTSVAPTDIECEELGEHEEQRQADSEEDNTDMSDGSCSCG